MGMSIEEAIKHAEEVGNGCNECAAEHRQLAEWLRKYQKIEEIYKNEYKNYKIGDREFSKEVRNVLKDGND